MKVKKHFRTSSSNINLIISDFSFSRIGDKDIYLRYCVNQRIEKLSQQYDNKLDNILSYIITSCNYDNLPLDCLSRIIMSLSKITNALSKGFMSLIN